MRCGMPAATEAAEAGGFAAARGRGGAAGTTVAAGRAGPGAGLGAAACGAAEGVAAGGFGATFGAGAFAAGLRAGLRAAAFLRAPLLRGAARRFRPEPAAFLRGAARFFATRRFPAFLLRPLFFDRAAFLRFAFLRAAIDPPSFVGRILEARENAGQPRRFRGAGARIGRGRRTEPRKPAPAGAQRAAGERSSSSWLAFPGCGSW